MVNLNTAHVLRAEDSNGASVSGANLYVYENGTTTEVTTYSDSDLTSANAHPVVADSSGSWGSIYVASGTYKIDVTTPGGTSLPGYPVNDIQTASQISAGSIGTTELADGSVTTAKLAVLAVTTAKLADNSVTLDKLEHGTKGDILYYGASGEPFRLGIEAEGKVLKVSSGGLPSWGTDIDTGFSIQTAIATLSGTSHDHTGIPSGANRVTLTLSGVELSGTDALVIQIGDSDGPETSNYLSKASQGSNSGTSTTGFLLTKTTSEEFSGVVTLVRIKDNEWVIAGVLSSSRSGPNIDVSAGSKTLSGELTQVRLKTSGTDTFTAGLFNIGYELANNPGSGTIGTFVGVRVYQTSATTSIDNGGKIIAFDTESFDTGSMHDNSTNNSRLTANSSGYWMGSAQFSVKNADQYTYVALSIKLNGVIIGINEKVYAPAASEIPDFQVATSPTWMDSGDYLEFFVALTPTDDSQPGENFTWLSMHKVGS